jgi:hypothetical protein
MPERFVLSIDIWHASTLCAEASSQVQHRAKELAPKQGQESTGYNMAAERNQQACICMFGS